MCINSDPAISEKHMVFFRYLSSGWARPLISRDGPEGCAVGQDAHWKAETGLITLCC